MSALIQAAIAIFLPMLTQCFTKASAEDPQTALKAHYDAASDTFDDGTVSDAMPHMRRSLIRARRQLPPAERRSTPRPTTDDVRTATIAGLKKGLAATTDEKAAIYAAAASLPDDGSDA